MGLSLFYLFSYYPIEFYQSCQDGNLQSLKSLMELIPEHIDMPNAKRMTPLMM